MPDSPYRVLFVCMGNICRSPAGEGVLRQMLAESQLAGKIEVDSAGTIDYHTGKHADSRMRAAAAARGIELKGRARAVRRFDFDNFDLVLAMDHDNFRDLTEIKGQGETRAALKLFCDYCTEHEEDEVPDPYYGGNAGFERVLDLLEDGCAQLIAELQSHR